MPIGTTSAPLRRRLKPAPAPEPEVEVAERPLGWPFRAPEMTPETRAAFELLTKPQSWNTGFVELDHTTCIPGLSVDHIGRLVFKHMENSAVIQTDVTDKVSALIDALAKELIPEQKD